MNRIEWEQSTTNFDWCSIINLINFFYLKSHKKDFDNCNGVNEFSFNGYTYTFELEPEMNCKVGDQIVLDYFGRVADAARFFDKVLVQNIIYKSL